MKNIQMHFDINRQLIGIQRGLWNIYVIVIHVLVLIISLAHKLFSFIIIIIIIELLFCSNIKVNSVYSEDLYTGEK